MDIETLENATCRLSVGSAPSLDAPPGLDSALHEIVVLGVKKHNEIEVGGLVAVDQDGKYSVPQPIDGAASNIPLSRETLFMLRQN